MRDDDWAEDHGYCWYRCPRCHKRFATDSAVECPYCGEGEETHDGDTITDLMEMVERVNRD